MDAEHQDHIDSAGGEAASQTPTRPFFIGMGYPGCAACPVRRRAICEILDDAALVLMEDEEARWREAAGRARGIPRITRKELVETYDCLMG